MRILYVLPFVPCRLRVRTYNLLARLARKHEIYLACVTSVAPTEQQRESLDRSCKKVIYVPHKRWRAVLRCAMALPTKTPMRIAYCESQAGSNVVRKLLVETKPDVIYVDRWRALQYLPEETEAPVVCDPTDSMTLYNSRLREEGAWWERLVGWVEHRRFLEYEPKLARRADVTAFCSRVDLECVREQAPEIQYVVVPNGVDCEKFYFKKESEEEPETLVFTGNFNYRPNLHAVNYFLEDIYPRIQTVVPSARFLAVGNGAEKVLARHRHRAGFTTMDFVPDLRPYLARGAVAIAPLTLGAGVTNKLTEAFAVGTPMVATPLACADLPVKSGEHLLIGKDAEEFAVNVVRLLRDRGLRRDIAIRARRLAENYDWEIVAMKMESVLQGAVERKSERPTASVALA